MRRIAIDTNIYAAFKNNDAKVLDTLRNCDYIGVDVTVIAELLSGFKMGSREKANRAELESFLDTPRVDVLHHNMETTDYYALIVKCLKTKGRPIPVNDIWIASNAMRDGLALYSFDKHFSEIEGLKIL
ncbi:MAG TPA: VapC toxin family PIN domain ribonuclease [Lentisphaeria bacterium]|nr:MAG: twitching motility protein PilT [Lentisphaerae bacterium GWF2_49_21]HBC89363.1 VapC toxin family PIN domain ribonuclease [Lentisphaeria bacterium]